MSRWSFVLGKGNREMVRRWLDKAPDNYRVEISEPRRSNDQNSLMWVYLTEISRQVDWYGNRLTPDEWKDVFSAAMKRTKVVPGLDGGFVVCGQSTSKMTRAEMSEMQTLMEAFGAEKGVRFAAQVDVETGEIT